MASFLGTLFSTAATEVVSKKVQAPTESKKTIKDRLDPVSLLATIALMKYQPEDTKIHIGDHNITTSHSSDYTYGINFHGLSRMYNGDSKEDVAIIKTAIHRIASWHQPDKEENEEIRTFLNYVMKGMRELRKTYIDRSPITVDALKYYQFKIVKYKIQAPKSVTELDTITKKIKGLWSKSDIAHINDQFRRMKEQQGTTPVATKVLCETEILAVQARLNGKFTEAKKIYA